MATHLYSLSHCIVKHRPLSQIPPFMLNIFIPSSSCFKLQQTSCRCRHATESKKKKRVFRNEKSDKECAGVIPCVGLFLRATYPKWRLLLFVVCGVYFFATTFFSLLY